MSTNLVNTWEEYEALLQRELKNGVRSEGFRHSAVTKPDGTVVQFRSMADLRSELTMVRNEIARTNLFSGNFSPFIAECAP